jgi:hypothetical protein
VQSFLSSNEFRSGVVEQVYGFPMAPVSSVASTLAILLHRTTAAQPAKINGWVNSGLDMLGIEAAIAAPPEFFTNG